MKQSIQWDEVEAGFLALRNSPPTQAAPSARIGKPKHWVLRRLQLLKVIPALRKAWDGERANLRISHFSVDMMELLGSLPAKLQETLTDEWNMGNCNIGSPFREFSDALQYRLKEAGVRSILLDGRQSPADRGELAEGFKSGKHSVLIAGLDSMGEGYNFDNCAHVILPSLSWAMDVNEQFIHRIWRLTSTKPVTIYTLVIAGSIDERLYESFAEKSTSAQLAIDHRLLDNPVEAIDIDALLKKAVRCFDPAATTIDEKDMEEQWHTTLRRRITEGEIRFRQVRGKSSKQPGKSKSNPPLTALGLAIHRNRLNRRMAGIAQ